MVMIFDLADDHCRAQAGIRIRTVSDRWSTPAEAEKHVNVNVDLD